MAGPAARQSPSDAQATGRSGLGVPAQELARAARRVSHGPDEPRLLRPAGPAASGKPDSAREATGGAADRHGDAVKALRELLQLRRIPARVRALEVRLEHNGVGDRPAGQGDQRVLLDEVVDRGHAARGDLHLAERERVAGTRSPDGRPRGTSPGGAWTPAMTTS